MQRFSASSSASAMAVWLVLVLLVVYGDFHAVVGVVIRENPVDTNTTPGSTVVLRCAVNNDPNQAPYTVYWYRHNPTDAYLTKGTQVFHQTRTGGLWQRLTVEGNSASGEYFLKIQTVQMSDAGGYSCVYFQGETYLGESRIATITVFVAPDEGYPFCSMEPTGVYLEPGQSVVLTCVSSGGTPVPRLDWMSWHEILPGRVEQDPQPKATYELQLTETDNGAVFTCVEDTPATPQLRTCSLKPFHRPTNVSITTSPVSIGEDAVFTCFGQGIPTVTNYTWTVAGLAAEDYISSSGEKVVVRKDNQVLRIINVKEDDNATIVKCHANNEINEEGTASTVVLISELLLSGKNMRPRAEDGQRDGAGISAGIIVGCALFIVLVVIGIIFLVRKHRMKNSTASEQDTETQVIETQPLRVEPTDEARPAEVAMLQSHPRPVTICLTPRDAIVEHIRESEESGGQPVRPTDDSGSRVTVVGRLSCAGMTHDFGDIGVMYSKPIKKKDQQPEQQTGDNPKKTETEDESKPKKKPKPALRPKPKLHPKPVISAPIQQSEELDLKKQTNSPEKVQDNEEDEDGENIYENMGHRPDITMDLGEEMEPYLRSKFTNWNGGQAKLL